MKKNYKSTVNACFAGYVVQSIVNNFVPLLFLTFNKSYGIELSKITALITVNFILQLCIDLLSAFFIDKIGYRAAAIMAHVFAAAGLVSLTVLPEILPSPFVGLLISVVLYAVGGGLLEVIVSPIVEACPTDNKEKMMSLLHSFYCWGSVAVVGLSTLYFSIFTTANWKYLALIWAVVPIVNALNFVRVPIASLIEEGEKGLSFKELLGNRMFWVFMLLILCSGASEQAVSQWASTFAEKGLGVSKTVGDLAGPMLFSVLMGVSRMIYGKFGDKIDLDGMMIFSGALCMASYLLIALSSSCARACRSRAVRLLGRHHVAGNVQQGVRGDKGRRNGDVRSSGARRRSRLLFRPHFCRNDGERIRRRPQKRHTLRHIFPGAFNRADNFYKTQKSENLISKSGRIRMINPCSAALIYFCGLHLQE